ncbi:MAG TPA: hypothetical protein VFB60_10605 [Ktedonobacteraceae bacterium]|nr:hypothetical protein [Ktedonobacteraceae bacterium]
MTIQLANPVAALTEKIAQPFDEAAPTVCKLANLYNASNTQLRTHQQTLSVSFKGLGADAFVTMISKQINWVDTITGHLNDLAGLYETCANDVRAAARAIEYAVEPFLDVAQWVVDRLTPDIVVKQGEDAVHAVFDDMRAQLQREMNDAGGFFSNLVHAHFGAALHDAVDGVKGLAHLGGDVLAMVAAVEPILCQWAANIYQAVNWLLNKLNSWLLAAADWLLGLSNIADDTVVFTDPNSTDAEKWMAGIDMGLNIAMDVALFIPGADIFSLAGKGIVKLLEKFGLKELLDVVIQKSVARLTETVAAQIVKDFIDKFTQKLMQKYSEIIVNRALEKGLTKAVFQRLKDEIKPEVSAYIQKILEEWSAGNISLAEAHAEIQALVDFANKYGVDRLKYILSNYDADTLRVILNGDHLPALHPGQPWEVWHLGPNQPGTTVPRNFIMRVGETTYYVNANATKHLAEYALSAGKKTGNFGFPMSAIATVIEKAQEDGLIKAGTGKQFFRIGAWEIGIDTNEHVIYHLVYRP